MVKSSKMQNIQIYLKTFSKMDENKHLQINLFSIIFYYKLTRLILFQERGNHFCGFYPLGVNSEMKGQIVFPIPNPTANLVSVFKGTCVNIHANKKLTHEVSFFLA